MKVHCFVLAIVPFFLSTTSLVFAEKSTQQYLEEGNEFFTNGQYDDALRSFGAAINQDPNKYLSYFRRAVTYLSMGRSTNALQDFTKILELKPDFDQALLQRAKLYLKDGSLTEARRDLQKYLKKNDKEIDAKQLLQSIDQAEKMIKDAEEALTKRKYDECIEFISKAIITSPRSSRLRLMRAECHLSKGEMEEGARDLSSASQLNPNDLDLLVRLVNLNYFILYDPKQSLQYIKQCIKYDPENKVCKNLKRKTKQFEDEVGRVSKHIEGYRFLAAVKMLIGTKESKGLIKEVDEELKTLKTLSEGKRKSELLMKLYAWACKAYAEIKDKSKEAVKWCSETLKLDENNVEALISRAEVYILEENYEGAMEDFKKAHDLTQGQDNRASRGYQKASKLHKQSKKKDYYKILRVPRTSSKKEIKKAYRKLAQEWHPDKYRGDMTLEQVEAKMASINEAYEVLSNDDLRARFDNGEDPNDPNGGSQPFFYSDNNPFMQFAREGFQFGGFPFGASDGEGGNQQYFFKFP
ncbi:putative Co-chaperone [Glomus cerebriforme]|uniref:Tetratricopeptide repeat and J domain-containing co-chaperone DNJ1 n=1 Tax=Glomus cerebriforme TaxID=658196 RepID=A0A397TDJ6_9GLOM|nr:putative Co-chaperone [Glomus cerebriforme]